MTLVKLPGQSIITNGKYQGEALGASATDFFASVNDDTIATFLIDHPSFFQKL